MTLCLFCWCPFGLPHESWSQRSKTMYVRWMVHTKWTEDYSVNGLSSRSFHLSRSAERDKGSSKREGLVAKWLTASVLKLKVQCWSNQLLCNSHHVTSAGFSSTMISGSRNYWGCWPSLHISPKVPLWAEFHRILLGCCKEIPQGTLWLLIQWPPGEYPKSPRICWTFNNSQVGAPHDSMDACIQGRKEAQKQVKQFSSWRYDLHRHVPETVARAFD